LSGAGAGAIVVDEEISFRGVGYKGGDNSEDVGQLVDGSAVVKSPSRNFGCVEGYGRGRTCNPACGSWHYCWHATGCILHGITGISDVSSRRRSTGTVLG